MPNDILIGVSGGVAAFKSALLVSRLVQDGHAVSVVMTRAARRFVGPATFEALTGRKVPQSIFSSHYPLGPHIELAGAKLMCVAPATANTLAKAASGLADDLLSTHPLLPRACPIRPGDELSDVGQAGRATKSGNTR